MTDIAQANEDRFEKLIAILIALTSIFIAITAYLESRASANAEQFDREAQALSIQATTERINGALRFSYDWQGAFQTWRELDLLTTNAEQIGDTVRADSYRAVRDELLHLSPLLQDPYFDPAAGWSDPNRYEADLYVVESTRLWEQFENKSQVSNSWDEISNGFVLQLTLYAVALSLFGLSTTIHSFVRWVFILLGGSIVVVNIFWGAASLFIPIEEVPSGAIDAYARGIGLAYQFRDEEAIAAFSEAIGSHPGYANAIYNRGFSRLVLGDYEGAVEDMEATLAAGRVDTSVLWNLAWGYYLLGRFDEAVSVNQQALALDPTLIGVRLNQGLTMLALGRFDNASEEYRLVIVEAERQVAEARTAGVAVPSSLWYYLDVGALDIMGLIEVAAGSPKEWMQAPAVHLIPADPERLRSIGEAEIVRLKEYTVSLELFGTAPLPRTNRTVSEFIFSQESFDENGNFIEYVESTINDYGTNQVGVRFDYAGFKAGEHELWKVYVNGYEDTALRVIGTWELAESGSAIKWITYAFSNVFVFLPGEFRVELYIDAQLMRTGTFTVLPP